MTAHRMMHDRLQPDGPLREGELFRLLAKNVVDYAMFIIDADRKVQTWSPGAERLLGYREAEILGQSADRFFTQEDLAAGRPEREIREALETGRGEDDRWHVRKDGRRFWSAGALTPLRDETGRLHGFAKIMRDRTDLYEAEEARRQGEERFRGLMEQAPFSIQIFSPDGRTLRVNRAWEKLWSATAAEAADYNVLDDPQLEAKGTLPHLRRAFAGEPAFLPVIEYDPNETVPGRTRDEDARRWVAAVAYPLKDAAGRVREVVLVHEDITDRVRAERNLRAGEERLRLALDAGRMGTWDWDVPTRRIRWSENLEAIHGLPPGSFDGTFETFERLVHPEDLPVLKRSLDEALHGGTTFESEFRIVRPDGTIGWMSGRGRAYYDEKGEPLRMVGVGADVADRKEAERRLQLQSQVLDSMAEGVSVTDENGFIVYTNPAEDRIFGYGPGELIGKHVTEQNAYPPEENRRIVAEVIARLKAGGVWSGDFLNRRKDGTAFTTACRISALDLDGRTYFVCVQEDVTDRRRAETELSRQTSLFKTITDNADSALVMVDTRGRLTFVNPAFSRITGYTEDEAKGRLVHETVHYKYPDGRPFPIEECPLDGAYRKDRKSVRGHEDTFVRKDGTLFPIVASVAPLEEAGEVIGCVAEFRDVTQEKSAAAALRRNERISRFLADASAALAALTDQGSTLQKVARLAVPHFADWCTIDMLVEGGGALQRVAAVHVDPDKVALAEEFYRRFPPDPDAPHGLWRIVRTGESEIVSNLDAALRGTPAGESDLHDFLVEMDLRSYIGVPIKARDTVLGVLSFITAESGRRYDERDLALAEDLAHRAAVAIENVRLYEELRDADRRKDDFLAMLAHELRNPLAPIRSGLDLLRLSGTETEIVDLMSGQIEHLVRLVNDLLDVSRIVRGRVELKREPVELADVVRRAVETVRPMIDEAGQGFSESLPTTAVRLDADPVRLAQVLTNLLNNASKYTEQGGRIALTAEQNGDGVEIRVSDTGIGIDADLIPHVFDLFRQSTRAIDRSQGGLGIGLTIVKSLVEMHGGSVAVRSEGPGKGSEFTVRLPVFASTAGAVAAPPADVPVKARRILVVDDNVPAAKLLVRLLAKLGSHEVVTAHDGPGALAAAEAYQPDLVLLDIGLPRMDGYEVARRLRTRPEFDRTLLVALTGYGTEEDRRRAAEAGFDEHVVKPPSVEMLRAVLSHPRRARA